MNKIFIANVATDFTNEELTKLMSPFGTVISVKVVANKKEGFLSFAFVEFEEEKSARKAIKYFEEHPMSIEDDIPALVVKEAKQREERSRINMVSRRDNGERRSYDSSRPVCSSNGGDYRRRY